MKDRIFDYQRPFIDLLDRTAVFARQDPIAYGRIRASFDRVRQWYADRTGWIVVLNRELARLLKAPAAPSASLGFRWAQSPLDYELLTWVLWYAEAANSEQFLLSQLIQEIEARAKQLIGPDHLSWDDYSTRLALARVLKHLEAMGALDRVHGETESWVTSGAGDTLFEFAALADYLAIQPPFETPEPGEPGFSVPPALRPLPGVPDPRQRLYRTLLLQPGLYRAADPEAFELLRRRESRERIALDLRETFGWDLEVTQSYAAALRPSGSIASEPELFPIRGALGHVVLLLATALRDRIATGELVPDPTDRVRVSHGELVTYISGLRQQYSRNWGATLGNKGEEGLVREVIAALQEWDFLIGPDEDGQFTVLPALGRYAGAYVDETGDDAEPEDGGPEVAGPVDTRRAEAAPVKDAPSLTRRNETARADRPGGKGNDPRQLDLW